MLARCRAFRDAGQVRAGQGDGWQSCSLVWFVLGRLDGGFCCAQ
jgi:hypothetical protein